MESMKKFFLKSEFGRKKEKERKRRWFLENGSILLKELIADCNGKSIPIRSFTSDQILKATSNFDSSCFVVRDVYYQWFRGKIEDRSYMIKRFAKDNFTDRGTEEGYNDFVLSARVSNHSGFLKLTGCCLEFPNYPVVVFEKPEYGVLNSRGSVGCEDEPLLPWNVRLKIAKEVAIAITYLHTAFPKIIIHRGIKPANVMLDKNWTAKLTDFSLALTLPEGKTWIKDEVRGTNNVCIDPIYVATGIVTEYTDVFSFGILMLVLLMGIPTYMHRSHGWLGPEGIILDYVKDLQARGDIVEFGGDSNDMRPGQMNMFLDLALRCCEERNEDRPKMILVAKEIKRIQGSLDC